MMAILGPLVGLIVGALIVAVICLFYILAQRRDYEEECADLRRQVKALDKTEVITSMCLPDLAERAKIRADAEVRMIRECESRIILGVRQALNDGEDHLNLCLKHYPRKTIMAALNIIEKDGDYKVEDLSSAATDRTYRITWC